MMKLNFHKCLYKADYFRWKYVFGGHFYKQFEKRCTNRKARRFFKARIRNEIPKTE